MRFLHSATLGIAVALGAADAHAQSVISRQIDNEPVETTVTQTPSGTVVTRRPLSATAPIVESLDVPRAAPRTTVETVGVAPRETRTVHHAHTATRAHRATTRTVARTVRRQVAAARPLVLDPVQRRVIYRTIVQQQIVPQVVQPVAPLPPAGYPPYPQPAYRGVVVPPEATTGYAVSVPTDDVDDVTAEETAPTTYPVVYPVGAQLPAGLVATPLPATAMVRVPAARPYSYVTVDNRVLLVDPATNTVVADITP